MKVVVYILLLFPWSAAGLFLLRLVVSQRKHALAEQDEPTAGD
jgi:hypothetical protein